MRIDCLFFLFSLRHCVLDGGQPREAKDDDGEESKEREDRKFEEGICQEEVLLQGQPTLELHFIPKKKKSPTYGSISMFRTA